MTSLSDGVLGARPRGASNDRRSRRFLPIINYVFSLPKKKTRSPSPDNVFHGPTILRGSPPARTRNGQINLNQMVITPLDALNITMREGWHPGSYCRWKIDQRITLEGKTL